MSPKEIARKLGAAEVDRVVPRERLERMLELLLTDGTFRSLYPSLG